MRVLLAEDDSSDAALLKLALSEGFSEGVEIIQVSTLKETIALLNREDIDLVMLDLSLPDSSGLDTAIATARAARETPIVVLTGLEDENTAVRAIHEGVQDYVTKSAMNAESVRRAARFAIERHRAMARVERRLERSEELDELGKLLTISSSMVSAPATETTSGAHSAMDINSDLFQELVERYASLVKLGMEEQAVQQNHHVAEQLTELAEQMGFLKSGPRDVINVHSRAVQQLVEGYPPDKASALASEARFRMLELMGRLLLFYRRYYA